MVVLRIVPRRAARVQVLGSSHLLLQFSTTPKVKRTERESERVVRGRSAERIKVTLTYDNE